jgi:arsenite/tail-anchored protein-transporting ATPase
MRVILLTGKGGVGKTTHALATAFGAAAHGHRVFLLSADPAHSLGDSLARPVGGRAAAVAPGVVAREVNAQEELDRSWSEIQRWLRALLREGADPLVADEILVFPGLEELMALRAVREVEATGEYDVCVVDCAPTGATLRMLRFPDALRIFMGSFFELERRGARLLRPLVERTHAGRLLPQEAFFDAVERLYGEIEDVRQILLDGDRTSARLVTNPARVVVDETRRAFAYLSLYGVASDALIVNRVLPEAATGGWFGRWAARERTELDEIRASFPLPLLLAPLRPGEVRGEAALRSLAEELYAGRDPAARLAEGRPLRFVRGAGHARLEIELPGVSKEEVEVAVRGDELFVRVRDVTRRIALPASLAGRRVRGARLEAGRLRVELVP